MSSQPIIPDYTGPNLSGIIPNLLGPTANGGGYAVLPDWFPDHVRGARQVCLLVLDGLGWDQLVEHRSLAPHLASMSGGPISSVAPTTTATALSSIATGLTPGEHGLIGYRVAVGGEVLNVLRWCVDGADRRRQIPPGEIQRLPAFLGERVPVLMPAELSATAFSTAHLQGADHIGYRAPSSLPVDIARTLEGGARFVYAYYGTIDKIAHERGFGEYYDSELGYADRLVGEILDRLPPGAALLVTSDHGQVEVGDRIIEPSASLLRHVALQSGEGRFRWFHAKPGAEDALYQATQDELGSTGWVYRRRELIEIGVFGPTVTPQVERRLGDVAALAREPVSYFDPNDTGPFELVCRHGSLTSEELFVPLLGSEVAS